MNLTMYIYNLVLPHRDEYSEESDVPQTKR